MTTSMPSGTPSPETIRFAGLEGAGSMLAVRAALAALQASRVDEDGRSSRRLPGTRR
jgi:hypothetical protein